MKENWPGEQSAPQTSCCRWPLPMRDLLVLSKSICRLLVYTGDQCCAYGLQAMT